MFFVLIRSLILIAFFFLRILFLSACFRPLLMFLIAALLSVYTSIHFFFGTIKIAAHIATNSTIVDVCHHSKPSANFSFGHSCVLSICTHLMPILFLILVSSLVFKFAILF